MPKTLQWSIGRLTFDCGERTLVMGILNTTPDSFSDGGLYLDADLALRRSMEMIEGGADIIDIGGESSRPGSEAVNQADELRRVVPVIEAVRREFDIPISIDTTKAAVAREALAAGADIINDITALTGDPDMINVAAQSGCGVVLMHMQGTPRTMQTDPHYDDCVSEINDYLQKRIESCIEAGIDKTRICIDPGIGFGKRLEDNLDLVASGNALRQLGVPVLIGASRKGFIGTLTNARVDERLEGSLAVAVASVLAGADIVRVHDVAPTRRAVLMADAMRERFEHNIP
jgi:dihydropteroate synthase